jgi:hypothetical protein
MENEINNNFDYLLNELKKRKKINLKKDENDIKIKKVIQATKDGEVKFFENTKETVATLRKKLKNNKDFKEEYKIVLEIEKYFNVKNIEELNEEQLEQLKLKIKDIFVNTLYTNINKKKEVMTKKHIEQNVQVLSNIKNNAKQKLEKIVQMNDLNFIIDFTELFLDTANDLMFIASNSFIKLLKEKTTENIQLNLESKYLNLEAIDKKTLIKKTERQELKINKLNNDIKQLKTEKKDLLELKSKFNKEIKNNSNNKENEILKQQIKELEQFIKDIEQKQKNIEKEIEKEKEKVNLYEFNLKTSNKYIQDFVKQKQDKKLELDIGLTPKPFRKRIFKM